jgi:subfamily B ATP-binding cassette protein MsbA
MRLFARIVTYLKPHWWVFVAAVACTFIFAGLDAFSLVLFIPFLEVLFVPDRAGVASGGGLFQSLMDQTIGRVVDLQGDPLVAIQGIIVFIIAVFLVKNLFQFGRSYLVARVEQGVTRDLRRHVYNHILELDLVFFGRTRTGQIISRLTHDVEQIRTLVTKELAKMISSFFEFAYAVAFMTLISAKLTAAAFIVLPGTLAVWGPLLRKLRKADRRVLDLAGEVSAHIQETLSGVRLVKTAAAERHERGRFHDLTGRYFRTFVRAERIRALAAPITEMVAAAGTAILLWYGARLVLVGGELSGAHFIAFLVLSTKLYAPVKYLSKLPAVIQPGLAAGDRLFEFLDAPVEIRDRPGAEPFLGFESHIAFQGVSFEYRPGQPVLREVSLRVPKGSVVALVGPSGAGKTTLVDLVGRFYEVSSGRITIDGRDIREFSIGTLRQSLGIVSQETVLFHDTVRNNIAYGMNEVPDRDVERAAKAAHAHDFISRLPHGYDTIVGERGTQLSGGQRQRIAIARAILRDPPILIFDEATSALDTESERLVQDAIEHLLEGRTVFVIAHRLSTVQRADQILVLEDGRIVEQGNHESLLLSGGLYRKLHDLQFSAGTSVQAAVR